MKNSFKTAASVLVLAMAVAAPASARDGVYVALRGGTNDYNINDKEDSAVSKSKADFGSAMMMSGAIGYKYRFFRIEAEYVNRDDIDGTYPVGRGYYKSTLESYSYMANLYLDLMPNYWVSPFLSAGIGMTNLEITNQNVGQDEKDEYSEDNFTWSLGAGLSIRLNKCLNIDGGYRYYDMGDINKANMNSHEWYAGLRFTF